MNNTAAASFTKLSPLTNHYACKITVNSTQYECPKPKHRFLNTPDLDSDLEEGLDHHLGGKQSKATRAQERNLRQIQNKVLKTTGPLSQLWTMLDNIRKQKETTTSVKPLLKLVEQ